MDTDTHYERRDILEGPDEELERALAAPPRNTILGPLRISRFIGGFWFRLFGFGASVLSKRIYPPLFSSRPRPRRLRLHIAGYRVRLLWPFDHGTN